ncbi:MAG: hypothetical protein AB8H86_23655 [Polyangiales bacterium]
MRQATLPLVVTLVALIGACGHDVTSVDVMFLASDNPGQTQTQLPWGSYERIAREDHAVHVFARLSEHYDDTTTFDAARVARVRAGSEALNVRVAFTAWSGVDAEATELAQTVLETQVLQDGSSHACSPATQAAWTCPVRYKELEVRVRYELPGAAGESREHEVMVRLAPAHLRHEVNNSVALTIGGV